VTGRFLQIHSRFDSVFVHEIKTGGFIMRKKLIITGFIFICFFILWTWTLTCLDVQPIGPNGTYVGMSTINILFHNFTGVHFILYVITDWLGLVPILACLFFSILGFMQWIKRKHIKKVDPDILILGLYYIIVVSVYLLFENVVINYRPVLINGYLEASYPSSNTLLVLCVMPTVQLQVHIA
jgi:undecaprenyl-diphosphatase